MRKLLSLALLLLGLSGNAQNLVTFTVLTQPCANNGVLQATATGVTPPVTYYWSAGGTQVTNTTGILTNYSGGPVSVYAVNSQQNTAYGYFQGSPPFNYNVSATPAICPALGSATATITGGTAPYTIQWFNSGSSTVVATGTPVSLAAGAYEVLITDAAGCTYGSYAKNDSIYVAYSSPVNFTLSATTASCTNGTAQATGVSGGTPPYSYLWSNAANTPGITGLVTGSYSVTVTDAQGCYATHGVYVPQSPNITVNTTPTPATCLLTNGSAIAFASGGAAPYTYTWSNAQNTQTATNLSGGNSYQVTATDANGCIGHGNAYIFPSTPITATYSATASSCTAATGTATVTATGGTAPYTVVWNTYPAQTGATATGLAPGTYYFTVTDNLGCVRTGTAVVPPISIVSGTVNVSPATCTQANGGASVILSAGTPPYTYSWSSGPGTSSVSNLAAGSYSVTVTDNLGCHITKSFYVPASSPINLGFNVTQASCIYATNGSIAATATGGTAPYTYSWSNSQTTSTATGLATGTYYLTVHDNAGCSRTATSFVPYNAANNSCYCTVTGTVYNDLNANCVKDAGEPGIPNIMVHCSGLGYAFTNAAGVYSFKAPTGTYTLSESVQAYYPLAACQSNAVPVTVTAAANCTTTVNFANVVNPIHDVSVQTLSLAGPPVPGNTYTQSVVVGNGGTVPEAAIAVGYKHDGQLGAPLFTPVNFVAAGANHYSNSPSFPSLNPAAYATTNFVYNVPTNIPLSTGVSFLDSAAYTAPMSNWLTDYTPWNNVRAYTATVVGSFDPNYKEVAPKGAGATGLIPATDSVLTYTIHFQNTGTWPAQKVLITDSLSPNLNLTTLKPGYSTHAYKAEVSESGVIRFVFDNINLPDSGSDPLGSMGLVTYSVHLKRNLAVGTQIKNDASIYFDYNAPVKTNTTLNTIQNGVGVPPVAGTAGRMMMDLYPNPAASQVTLLIQPEPGQGTADIRILNVSGQVVIRQQVGLRAGSNLFRADISSLSPGLYFVTVSDGAGAVTRKLSVIR